jgi:hypothetical protein
LRFLVVMALPYHFRHSKFLARSCCLKSFFSVAVGGVSNPLKWGYRVRRDHHSCVSMLNCLIPETFRINIRLISHGDFSLLPLPARQLSELEDSLRTAEINVGLVGALAY